MVICRESPIFATKSTHNMKRSFYFIPVWAVMAFAFLSCGEDRTYEFLAKTEVDNWIEAQMREIYLYYREIPQLETEDYFSPAEEFFPKLLASQDKYSYIEVPSSRICHGVSKSGSPTPREIASFISLTMSKNLRIPDGSISVITFDNGFLMVSSASFHLFLFLP